jgi:HrpA-like RNA helicase
MMQEMHDKDYVSVAAEVAVQIHSCKPPGDILVFLAGQAEVEKAVRLIHQHVRRNLRFFFSCILFMKEDRLRC